MGQQLREGDMTSISVRYWIVLTDLVWIAVAWLWASTFRFGLSWPGSIPQLPPDERVVLILGAIIWTFLYCVMHLDGPNGASDLPGRASVLILAVGAFISLLAVASYFAIGYVSCMAFGYLAVLVLVGTITSRWLIRRILGSIKRRGTGRRAVILADGRLAREVAQKFHEHPELNCDVIGSFSSVTEERLGTSAPPLTSTLHILDFLKDKGITDLIVVLPPPMPREVLTLVARCQAAGVRISLVPEPYELYTSRTRLVEVGGLPLLTIDQEATSLGWLSVKAILDRICAISFLIFCFPLFLVLALYLRMTGRRAFQGELRCGKDGAPFWMYRFNIDREAEGMNLLESMVCETSLTELPQLWNVLRGEMSIVGPRPESPDRVKHYSEWNRQRLRVKPGITGYAQVQGLRDRHSSEEKTCFDLQYILQWSPVLDAALVLQTAWTITQRAGATLKGNSTEPVQRYQHRATEV